MEKRIINKMIFLLGILVVLPFVVVSLVYRSRLSGYVFASASEMAMDKYLLVRSMLLILLAVVMTVMCIVRDGNKKLMRKMLVVCLYLIACTVLASDKAIAVSGCDEQFEGVFVLMAYGAIFLATRYTAYAHKEIEILRKAVAAAAMIFGVMALVQKLMGAGEVYLSLYNSNLAGEYMAIILPIMVYPLFEKKYIYAVPAIMCSLALVCTGAKSAIAAAIVMTVILIINEKKKCILYIGGLTVVVVFGWIVINAFGVRSTNDEVQIENIETLSDGVYFNRAGESLKICFELLDEEHYVFTLYDTGGNELEYAENAEGNMYEILDERYADYSFSVADYGGIIGFLVHVDGRDWYLYHAEDGEYYYLNGYTRGEKFIKAKQTGFYGNEGFASNRGYIWSRTLPMLWSGDNLIMKIKNLLLGFGPDCFAVNFPQNDLGMYLTTDFQYKTFITRPHSFYLQIWLQIGLLGLGAVMVCLVKAVIKVYKSKPSVAAALLIFMMCGLFYDSSVCVTPLVCILVGMGLSDNY